MRVHPYKMKLFVLCHFTIQLHESCKKSEAENEDYEKFIALLERICQKYTTEYMRSSNFKRYVELFNFLWDFNMKKIDDDQAIYPIILILHILKYCDWSQFKFTENDDLWLELKENFKVFDLLVWAREVHNVSNSFCFVKFQKSFENNFWKN